MTDIRRKIIKDTFVRNRPKCLSEDESSQAFDMWVRSIREGVGETDSNWFCQGFSRLFRREVN